MTEETDSEREKQGYCDNCHSNRLLYYYRGLWLCKTSMERCWRKRKQIHAVKLTQRKRAGK